MPKKIDNTGLYINTLFGPGVAMQVCNTCYIEKPVSEYHIESATKRKHNEQRRKQCKDCWYQFNGNSSSSCNLNCEAI